MKKSILFLFLAGSLTGYSQHVITMKNGDKLEGLVTSLNNGVFEIQRNQTVSKINLSEVASVNFLARGGEKSTIETGEKQVTAGSYLVRYKVADRSIAKPPRVDNLTQKKGTVVVHVSINKYGNVIKAVPGAAGSTTSDEYLLTKAKQAAESALFNNVPTAPLEQTGYMIIPF